MSRSRRDLDQIVFHATDDFVLFATHRSSATLGNPRFLADYVVAWLVNGNGVSRCNSDVQTYLVVLGAIIDKWRADQLELHFYRQNPRDPDGQWLIVEHRRPALIAPLPTYNHRIFNPAFFAEVAARKQRRRGR